MSSSDNNMNRERSYHQHWAPTANRILTAQHCVNVLCWRLNETAANTILQSVADP